MSRTGLFDAYGVPIDGEKLPEGLDIYFQIPLFQSLNAWGTDEAAAAGSSHELGEFTQSGRLYWAMISGDTRVGDGLEKRGLALRGMKVSVKPGKGQRAKTLAKRYEALRPRIFRPEVVSELLDQAIMMGQGVGQPVMKYDEQGPDNPAAKATAKKWFVPRVECWEPTLTRWIPGPWLPYWNTTAPQPWMAVQGQLTAITRGSMKDDSSMQVPIIPGTGQWLLFKLAGDRRPWMRGKLLQLWRPWIAARLALLGDVRFNDVHGMPVRALKVPMGMRKTPETQHWYDYVRNLGQNATMLLPQGTDGKMGVDLQFIEAKSESWKSFMATLEWTGKEITIALTGGTQNTEATGGNYKGAEEQREVRWEVKAATAIAWALMETEQMAEPFGLINGYEPEEAPVVEIDITPPAAEGAEAKAKQEGAKALTEAIRAWWEARRAGAKAPIEDFLAERGLCLPGSTKYEEPTDPPPSTFPGAQPGDAAAEQTTPAAPAKKAA